jgi:hypothetical protein
VIILKLTKEIRKKGRKQMQFAITAAGMVAACIFLPAKLGGFRLADNWLNGRKYMKTNIGKKFAAIGHKRWAIGEGYIPETSHELGSELSNHESISVLNASDEEAHVQIWIFYADHEPVGPYEVFVEPRRMKQIRFDDLTIPEPIPHGIDYASLIESNVPVLVQHTRLDSRPATNALISTIAFADSESLM